MNTLPGMSLKINWIYLNGLLLFALAVSIRLYIPALAAAPLGLPENSQDRTNASMIVYTMVKMKKFHDIHPYRNLKYLLDSRPSVNTSEVEFADLAPWSEKTRNACNIKLE